MEHTKGYYSLIQYCPDRSRMELCNLGVILFAPQINFLDIKIIKNNNKVKKFFGKNSFDDKWLTNAKNSLVYTIKNIKSKEEFEHFIQTRANELILSNLTSVRIIYPEITLANLFLELIQGNIL